MAMNITYNQLAQVLKRHKDDDRDDPHYHLCEDLCDYLAHRNSNFSRSRFIEACGYPEQETNDSTSTVNGLLEDTIETIANQMAAGTFWSNQYEHPDRNYNEALARDRAQASEFQRLHGVSTSPLYSRTNSLEDGSPVPEP